MTQATAPEPTVPQSQDISRLFAFLTTEAGLEFVRAFVALTDHERRSDRAQSDRYHHLRRLARDIAAYRTACREAKYGAPYATSDAFCARRAAAATQLRVSIEARLATYQFGPSPATAENPNLPNHNTPPSREATNATEATEAIEPPAATEASRAPEVRKPTLAKKTRKCPKATIAAEAAAAPKHPKSRGRPVARTVSPEWLQAKDRLMAAIAAHGLSRTREARCAAYNAMPYAARHITSFHDLTAPQLRQFADSVNGNTFHARPGNPAWQRRLPSRLRHMSELTDANH